MTLFLSFPPVGYLDLTLNNATTFILLGFHVWSWPSQVRLSPLGGVGAKGWCTALPAKSFQGPVKSLDLPEEDNPAFSQALPKHREGFWTHHVRKQAENDRE